MWLDGHGAVLAEHRAARNTYAEDIDPALGEIEKVRVEQARNEVLHDNDQPDPVGERRAPKQQQMPDPHRVEHYHADGSELDRNREGLVMRVVRDRSRSSCLANGGATEQLTDGPGPVPDNGRPGDERDRALPEFEPLAGSGADVLAFILPDFLGNQAHLPAQEGGGLPDRERNGHRQQKKHAPLSPSELPERKHEDEH